MDTNLPDTPDEAVPTAVTERAAKGTRETAKEPLDARVIRQERDLLLVEWQERNRIRRSWITPKQIASKTDMGVTVTDPASGIPYGVEWRRLVELGEVTPAKLEQELRRRGIWTIADLRANPLEVVGAIQTTYAFARAQLLQAAERYEQQLKDTEEK